MHIELRVDTEGYHATLKDAQVRLRAHHQQACSHEYEVEDFEGNLVPVRYRSIFCPDCGLRIEAPGPTRPFQLRPDQR